MKSIVKYLSTKTKSYKSFDEKSMTSKDYNTAEYILKNKIYLESYFDEDEKAKNFIAKWCCFTGIDEKTKLFTVLDMDAADSFIACGFVDEDDPNIKKICSEESFDLSSEELTKHKLDEMSYDCDGTQMNFAFTPSMLMFNTDGHSNIFLWIEKKMNF